jgi:hypothetical protein
MLILLCEIAFLPSFLFYFHILKCISHHAIHSLASTIPFLQSYDLSNSFRCVFVMRSLLIFSLLLYGDTSHIRVAHSTHTVLPLGFNYYRPIIVYIHLNCVFGLRSCIFHLLLPSYSSERHAQHSIHTVFLLQFNSYSLMTFVNHLNDNFVM